MVVAVGTETTAAAGSETARTTGLAVAAELDNVDSVETPSDRIGFGGDMPAGGVDGALCKAATSGSGVRR